MIVLCGKGVSVTTAKRVIKTLFASGVLGLPAALAASPAFAAQDYPPGLFEKSPVVPSGPPGAIAPSQPPDAADPFGPPDAVDPFDDYCDGLASRTFRSLAEVKRAHARCDHLHRPAPLSDSDVPEGMKGLW